MAVTKKTGSTPRGSDVSARGEGKASAEAAVMVTGGSGFVGQQLVRQLADQGRTIVSVYHHRLPESLDNVYPVCSDMSSAELMLAPLRGVETVVHLAWEGGLMGPEILAWPPQGGAPPTRNAQVLANLIGAMERAGTRRMVFLSAIGAGYGAQVPFLREKYLAELMLLNSKIPEKIILRSSVVWGGQGGDDRFLRSIMRVMKYTLYPVPTRKDSLSPVHVRDLADTITRACRHDLREPAAVLDVDGGQGYKVDELFRIVSDGYVKKTRFPVGGFLADSLLPLLERDAKNGLKTPKLRHFLALGGQRAASTQVENPLSGVLPENPASFKDHVTRQ